MGSILSSSAGFVLANVPDTPLTAPTSDIAISSYSRLKIDYATIAVNGGSPILSYSLEIDNGLGGDFIALYGIDTNTLSTTFTISSGIVRGRTYRVRYRARNVVGFSSYSPIGYLIAASKPLAPSAPKFVSAD